MTNQMRVFHGNSVEEVAGWCGAQSSDAALFLVFFGAAFDYRNLSDRLSALRVPFLGCMDTGRLHNDRYYLDETSVVAMQLSTNIVEAVQVVAYDMRPSMEPETIRSGARTLFRQALERIGIRSEDPDLERSFAINLLYGLNSANPVLEGQHEVSMFFQTVGGSSGGRLDFKAAPVISSRGRGAIGATAIVKLRPEYRYIMDLTTSYEKLDQQLTVTKLPGPRHIAEFNGRPAAEEYARLLNLSPSEVSPTTYATYTLGLDTGDGERLITSIQRGDGQGGLLTYNDARPGVVFNLYRALSQLGPRRDRLHEVSKNNVVGFVSFDCVLCYLARNARGEVDTIARNYDEALPGVPKIGFGTFSENFCGANVNQTETFLAIYRKS